MELVNILISTYNGEQYIEKQIESIIKQTYPSIKIYIRDDGSTDKTLDILQKYSNDERITVIQGDNVGFGSSFMQLLDMAAEGEYWAFCDQDDIWDDCKVKNAVEKLRTMEYNEPNMYFHNFYLTDENMNIIGVYSNRISGYSFQMAITECLHMGFATVINKTLRDLMLKGDIMNLRSHDWWAELIVMEFGNVYTDDYIGAMHRRLDSSLSSSSLKSRVKWFFSALKGNSEICNLTRQFKIVFEDKMNEKDRKVLSWFDNSRYNLIVALKKCFYYKRWRSSIISELVVRILMLVGKI